MDKNGIGTAFPILITSEYQHPRHITSTMSGNGVVDNVHLCICFGVGITIEECVCVLLLPNTPNTFVGVLGEDPVKADTKNIEREQALKRSTKFRLKS